MLWQNATTFSILLKKNTTGHLSHRQLALPILFRTSPIGSRGSKIFGAPLVVYAINSSHMCSEPTTPYPVPMRLGITLEKGVSQTDNVHNVLFAILCQFFYEKCNNLYYKSCYDLALRPRDAYNERSLQDLKARMQQQLLYIL